MPRWGGPGVDKRAQDTFAMIPRKTKNWTVTWNNPPKPYNKLFSEMGVKNIKFAIWQIEKGTCVHAQAYLQFETEHDLSWLSRAFPRIHAEDSRGSPADNVTYCSKNDTRYHNHGPYTFGTMNTRGRRNDLTGIQKEIEEGITNEEIARYHFAAFTRNYRAFSVYRNLIQEKRDWVVQVIALTGYTGCGKSWYCAKNAPNAYRQTLKDWFDGYEGQDDVIFDEFYGSRFTYTYFLLLLDRYEMIVGTKHGSVNWKPKRIFITSNKKPCDWYSGCDFEALDRRISFAYHVEKGEERESWWKEVDDGLAFLNSLEQ